MTDRQDQVLERTALYQPGVSRQVARLVDRGDADHLVPGTGLTMDEVHHYQLLARRLQARAVAAGFKGLFKAVLRPFAKLTAGVAQARRKAAAMRQLRALDDRLLADIGITRGQIHEVVEGLEARRSAEDTPIRPLAAARVDRRGSRPESCNDPHAREAA